MQFNNERITEILLRIQAIRGMPALAVGKSSEEIKVMIWNLAMNFDATPSQFEEFSEQAKAASLETLGLLAKLEISQRKQGNK